MSGYTEFDFKTLGLNPEHFYPHYLNQEGQIDNQLLDQIHEIISELPAYVNIKAGYKWAADSAEFKENHLLQLGKKSFRLGKIVYNMLKKSESICLFLCTVGSGISEWNKSLFSKGDFLKGYFVDLAGSFLADKAVESLSDIVEMEASARGMGISNTYSPGYCEWPVEDQQSLFDFFPEGFCGVKLTSSSLMIPEKSVSGIIGAGIHVKKIPYTCTLCNMKNCDYSKSKGEIKV